LRLFIGMNKLRSQIRKALLEIEFPSQDYSQENESMGTPVMIETEPLKAFLDQEGIFGMESELISILEKQPTPEVKSALESEIKFKQSNKQVETLSVEEMLNLYLELNNLQQYFGDIISFAHNSYNV